MVLNLTEIYLEGAYYNTEYATLNFVFEDCESYQDESYCSPYQERIDYFYENDLSFSFSSAEHFIDFDDEENPVKKALTDLSEPLILDPQISTACVFTLNLNEFT